MQLSEDVLCPTLMRGSVCVGNVEYSGLPVRAIKILIVIHDQIYIFPSTKTLLQREMKPHSLVDDSTVSGFRMPGVESLFCHPLLSNLRGVT